MNPLDFQRSIWAQNFPLSPLESAPNGSPFGFTELWSHCSRQAARWESNETRLDESLAPRSVEYPKEYPKESKVGRSELYWTLLLTHQTDLGCTWLHCRYDPTESCNSGGRLWLPNIRASLFLILEASLNFFDGWWNFDLLHWIRWLLSRW